MNKIDVTDKPEIKMIIDLIKDIRHHIRQIENKLYGDNANE